MMHWIRNIIIIAAAVIVFPGFSRASEKITAFVSIQPQKYFVEQIGKSLVDVHVMVQPGANPATYEPKPEQMVGLSRSRVYFAVGVPFENVWLSKIAAANPGMRMVHTDHGITKRPMAGSHHHDEPGHPMAGENHSAPDPHIWLSPPLVKIQAHTIMAALAEIDPVHQGVYTDGYREFTARIDDLDGRLKKIFENRQGMEFMVFHPAWGYFAQAYGLKQTPVEIEGKSPKPAQLQWLIQHARKSGIRVVFVQPQFSTKNADLIAGQIGGNVVFADPLAKDWISNMEKVAKSFSTSLQGEGG